MILFCWENKCELGSWKKDKPNSQNPKQTIKFTQLIDEWEER